MDYEFIKEAIPLYIKAAILTLKLSVFGIILSILVGLVCAFVRYLKVPIVRIFVTSYIELSRNTPLLIQLFFLYFALPKIGIKLSSVQCAVAGLAFLGGSYMAETFRSALLTVSQSQIESAECVGLTGVQVMLYLTLPQATTACVPGVCANIIFLIKETSVFSAVALADLMFIAKDLIGLYYKTDEALLLLVIAYFILLLPICTIASLLERRLRHAQFGF